MFLIFGVKFQPDVLRINVLSVPMLLYAAKKLLEITSFGLTCLHMLIHRSPNFLCVGKLTTEHLSLKGCWLQSAATQGTIISSEKRHSKSNKVMSDCHEHNESSKHQKLHFCR